MIKRLTSFVSALIISLSYLFVFVPVAHAATVAWDGGGADNNFSTATNWVGDAVPVNGDILTFPTSVDSDTLSDSDRVLNNDLTNLAVGGILVTGTYPTNDWDYYNITGNGFSSSGNIQGNDVSSTTPKLSLTAPLTLTANVTVQSVSSTSSLAIGSNTVTLMAAGFSGAHSGTGGTEIIGGYPSASGSGGGGCDYSTGADSPAFASSIIINANGGLSVTSNSQGRAYTATSITTNNGSLYFNAPYNQDMVFNKGITLNGGFVSAYQNQDELNDCANPTVNKQLTIPGNVTLTANTDFSLGHTDIKFTGTVTGKEFIKLASSSSGNIMFADGSVIAPQAITTEYTANSPSTSIYVNNNETAVITGTYGSVNVGSGGVLKGTGTLGDTSVYEGGKIAPGLSPGCLNTGNVLFEFGSTYDFELGGTTACTEYDQINATGTVTLNPGVGAGTGPTLNTMLVNGFKPAAGQTFTIINNDGTDAVLNGTFNNLAEGATFTVDGYVLKISYVGGDGNDVVLTVVSVPAVPDTGFKLLMNNPVLTLAATSIMAGVMLVIAKKYAHSTNR